MFIPVHLVPLKYSGHTYSIIGDGGLPSDQLAPTSIAWSELTHLTRAQRLTKTPGLPSSSFRSTNSQKLVVNPSGSRSTKSSLRIVPEAVFSPYSCHM